MGVDAGAFSLTVGDLLHVFVHQADGSLDFVDRAKYLIQSGGENLYPAEIERVLLAHEAVLDAAAVRRRDARWGEVPLAFVRTQARRRRRRAGSDTMVPRATGRLQGSQRSSVCLGRRVPAKQQRQDPAPRDRAPMDGLVTVAVRRGRIGALAPVGSRRRLRRDCSQASADAST